MLNLLFFSIYNEVIVLHDTKSLMFRIYILNLKVQTVDSNIKHNFHIEISLEIKFYIFFEFFR
jgi:hypothetical protein